MFVLAVGVLALAGCGDESAPTVVRAQTSTSGVRPVCCANPHGEIETPDAPVTRGSPLLPSAPAPPEGAVPCHAADLNIQSAFGVPVHDRPGLFVRIFNRASSCWLDGYFKVSLRSQSGSWRDFLYVAEQGSTTNGPEWTGIFDPKLVGVVVFGEAEPSDGPATTYDALRLTLPNDGGTLEYGGIDLQLRSEVLSVYAIEADSQDP